MQPKPDTIKVSAAHKEEIFASHANLYVTVKGSSLISGNEAMKKAREVSQLVEALSRFGLTGEAIQLLGVHLETGGNTLLKSSSATYRLRIHLKNLDSLAEVLDVLAAQKNTTLERIEWKYPEEAGRERGLEQSLENAKAKAEKVASSLNVRLLGIYDFIENSYDEERPPMPFQAQAMAMRKGGPEMDQPPSLGMDIQHSKTIHVNVEVWYRVSAFETE